MQPGQAADQRPVFGQRYFQLGKGIQAARRLHLTVHQVAALAGDVDVVLCLVTALQRFHATAPAPAIGVLPLVGQAYPDIFTVNFQHLEDGVPQRFLAVEARQLQAMPAVQLQGGDIADAVEGEVTLVIAGHCAQRGLLRVTSQLRLGQAAGDFRIGFHVADIEAGRQSLVDPPADIGEVALIFLARVIAETVLGIIGEAQVGIPIAKVFSHRTEDALVIKAAGLGAQLHLGRGLAGGRDKVDRPAQVGGAIAPGVGAAHDLDMVQGNRLDALEVTTAIGQVQRCAVLHQQDAALVEGALQPRTTNRQTRFLGAGARLDIHARGLAQGILRRAGAAGLVGFGIDDTGTTRNPRKLGALLGNCRRSGIALLLTDNGAVF